MRSTRRIFLSSLASLPLAASGLLKSGDAMAQDRYPSRAIKLIVPFGPGSSTDIAARSWAEVIGKQLGGASVIVDNRAGAGGNIGATAAARSAPDGYTFLYSTATTWAIAPFIYPDLAYQPTRDFTPVAVTTKQFEEQGTPLMPDMSLLQVNAFMKQDVDRWKGMVKEAQITV